MNDHLKGLLITTLGVLCAVPDSLFVRLIDAEPMVTAFWRGLTAGIFVLAFVLLTHGLAGYRAVFKIGWLGITYAVLLGSTTPAFVLAVENTSVANVVFIFASMPVFASIFSRLLLGESIQLRMVITMTVVIFGLGIIAYGSTSTQIASWKGDIWAVYISVVYAAALTVARKAKAISLVPVIPIAYIAAAFIISFFVTPMPTFELKWPLLLSHGAFIGAASCLLALGPRYIRSAEVSLLILLESVLAPLLVWWVIGENPGSLAIVGGAIVIGALLTSNIYSLVKAREQ